MTAAWFWDGDPELVAREPKGALDVLDGLVGRAADDPGAAFEPEVLEALAVLRDQDLAGYQRLRAALKAQGARVTALDAAVRAPAGDDTRPTQADRLVALAAARADLFHDADGEGYADLRVDGHRETRRLRTTGFRRWLSREYYGEHGRAPGGQALQDAIGTIEARAQFEGPERQVFVRVADDADAVYLDLGGDSWAAVEVTGGGWRVLDEPPVRFVRPTGLRPLPVPQRGGSIGELRPFLNLGDGGQGHGGQAEAEAEDRFKLVVAFLVAALRRRGPFPVLVVNAEQGAGKSTLARVLRRLIDPNKAEIRSAPRDERDLVIAANNGWLICLDNLSHLGPDLSDALCRVATGAGFATRRLYTDDEETLIQVCRPQVLNGIPDLATRPDLADRALVLTLPPLPEGRRRTEAEFWAAFDAAAPRILGALLDAVARALERRHRVKLARPPRMADFALWVEAAAPALGWRPGDFLRSYDAGRRQAVEATVEADGVAVAVRELVEAGGPFRGTATALLDRLNGRTGDETRRRKDWPKAPNALSNRLRRAAPGLRQVGVAVELGRDEQGSFIRLERAPGTSSAPSGSSEREESRGFSPDDPWMQRCQGSSGAGGPDGRADDPVREAVRDKPMENKADDAPDGADDPTPARSGRECEDAWEEWEL